MSNKPRNAILGIAFNYNDMKLFPFLKSLEQTGFKGDLVLFINNNTSLSSVINYDYNIIYVNVDQELAWAGRLHKLLKCVLNLQYLQRWWTRLHNRKIRMLLKQKCLLSRWMLGFFHNNFYLATARFSFYYNWLLKNDYDKVFFTDVNDVVFQRDVFVRADETKVLAFEEYDGLKLGNDSNNRRWVEAGYGSNVLDKMYDSVICCSGTILGNSDICLTFLRDFMLEMITGEKPAQMVGFDQGVFNYLVNYEKKNYFRPSKNGEIVFTVAMHPTTEIVIADKDVVLKDSGHVPAVVHQYNRHINLIEFIQERLLLLK